MISNPSPEISDPMISARFHADAPLPDDPRATTPVLRDITSQMLNGSRDPNDFLLEHHLCITCTYFPRIRRWRTLGSGKKADSHHHHHLTVPKSIRGVVVYSCKFILQGQFFLTASSMLPSGKQGLEGSEKSTLSLIGFLAIPSFFLCSRTILA